MVSSTGATGTRREGMNSLALVIVLDLIACVLIAAWLPAFRISLSPETCSDLSLLPCLYDGFGAQISFGNERDRS